MERGDAGLRDVVDDVAALGLERRGHRQHPFDEPAPRRAVGPEALPTPEDRGAQRPLGRIVRRLDPGHLDERPERRGQRQRLPARRRRLGVPTRPPRRSHASTRRRCGPITACNRARDRVPSRTRRASAKMARVSVSSACPARQAVPPRSVKATHSRRRWAQQSCRRATGQAWYALQRSVTSRPPGLNGYRVPTTSG